MESIQNGLTSVTSDQVSCAFLRNLVAKQLEYGLIRGAICGAEKLVALPSHGKRMNDE